MQLADRLQDLPPYLFAEISRKIAEKRAQGVEVVTFGIGDPDLPTPPHILDALKQASDKPENHRYPESEGLPELRQAIAEWYMRRFGIRLDPEREVLPLIGSKEGISHIALCLCNPGDVALVPDPGYPVYEFGARLAGARVEFVPLLAENGFLPDLEFIPEETARAAKLLWLNYPNNPTGAVADASFFEKAVAWAKRYEVTLIHDAPYTEVAFDNYIPVSLLEIPGARDVSVEFHSFSKSYNMTGWRIAMLCGNGVVVDAMRRLKSNIDSGIPQAIQEMAIAAARGPRDVIAANNATYQRRRDRLVRALRDMGLEVESSRGSLYLWARIPPGYDSKGFATELLDRVAVVVTPGTGYGSHGEGYVRLSLTIPDESLEEGLRRLHEWASVRA
ncbi:MAG: aminotransferase class I/II-fold pyridoxal phosphate-dependent enzyme [Dehalococcoidia bacterium]|nr:aminotransferase class I/II-fold pyridoxal phosphate-dependent enzyme [Dehalococcoidia bacterium]